MIMSDVFSPCHFLVNPGPFQRFCRHDVCACVDGEECLCSALAAYAAACAAKGVLLSWRSPSLCGNSFTADHSHTLVNIQIFHPVFQTENSISGQTKKVNNNLGEIISR